MRLSLKPLIPMVVAGVVSLVMAAPIMAHNPPDNWWRGQTYPQIISKQKEIFSHAKLMMRQSENYPRLTLLEKKEGKINLDRHQHQFETLPQLIKQKQKEYEEILRYVPQVTYSSGSSGSMFNCGLQFEDGWMDGSRGNPIPVCGDKNSQIRAAEWIAQNSAADPWPNCPDPYDGTGTWDDTAACENGGKW